MSRRHPVAVKSSLIAILAVLLPLAARAEIPTKIYAQELVDRAVAAEPRLLVVAMHVTPPGAAANVIIASNIGRIGKPADDDDLRVIETGKPNVEMSHGTRLEVELPMQDVGGATIGALGLVWRCESRADEDVLVGRAYALRDALARRVLNAANLMDPYPYAANATTKTRAQKLVDDMAARDPELIVLALRGPMTGAGGIALVGSTFGRHGKKADADDMKVLKSEAPATGIYSNGKRFGADLQLRDASGRAIGTMNVGYKWRDGADGKALLARALALRDEIEKRIPSAAALEELDP